MVREYFFWWMYIMCYKRNNTVTCQLINIVDAFDCILTVYRRIIKNLFSWAWLKSLTVFWDFSKIPNLKSKNRVGLNSPILYRFITLFLRYGSLPSQPHGSSKGIMNIQDHNFTLNRGEQIKSIKVFTSFESQFIIGLQFKTTTNRDSQIFGQNSRFNYEIKSPYSSRYFVEYLHGKSKTIFLRFRFCVLFPVRIDG